MNPEDATLLDKLTPAERAANAVPDPARQADRERAAALVADALGTTLPAGRLELSPLGPGWSNDLDVYLEERIDPRALTGLGWIPLGRLSRSGEPYGRWAVTAENRVLAGLDVHYGVPTRSEVTRVLSRCARRGRIGVREVLELRALQRAGHVLPATHPAVRGAARAEAALGGDELVAFLSGSPERPPVELDESRMARLRRRARRGLASPVIVAVSGVDGSGKSTLAAGLVDDLGAAGVEVTRVWARPGMEMRSVKAAAKLVKRLSGQGSTAAVRSIARGEQGDVAPSSRRGVMGWVWALLVTLSYVTRARSAVRRCRGVLVFDRHLLDALVTLDFVYGTVDLRLQRALVRALVPKAAVTFYLAISADDAIARKESAVFGAHAVRSQLELYERRRSEVPDLVELDAAEPPDVLLGHCLRVVGGGTDATTRQELSEI